MFGIHNYLSFIAAILIFQAIPGPGTIAILNACARNGVRAGMGTVLGTLSGDFIFMVAAAAGLAALLNANPVFFRGLQWLGAAYLCWIGLRLLRTQFIDAELAPEPMRSAWTYFHQAIAVSLTNPKVILFFVAFFPLFLKPNSTSSTLVIMMAHVTLISLVYQTGLVVLGNAVARRLKSSLSARKLATRLAGLSLVGFSIKLATSNH